MRALLRGPVAGVLATVPMTVVLLVAERRSRGGYRQPPEAVVRAAGAQVGAEPRGRAAQGLAVLAHTGFGAGLGAVLPLLPRRGHPAVRGTALSLAVYALSYRGWVPVLGALPPAERDRSDRQGALVAAHVVYGAALGVLEDRLRERR